ncbi:MAG: PAS domain-containing sensor histidine kinase [Bacteroidales bacterium]|nr:PAS domain-containing sensor histidine kinase [Bacteroidales bacterium]
MTAQSTNLTTTFAAGVMDNLGIGVWAVEFVEGCSPKLYADAVMLRLLGAPNKITPEELYIFWHKGLSDQNAQLVQEGFQKMFEGEASEVQYKWKHPDGSIRTVRCGGKKNLSFTSGIRCEGTHRDVSELNHLDEQMRRDSMLLKSYFNYYNAKDALAIILVNLQEDHYVSVKVSPRLEDITPFPEQGVFTEHFRQLVDTFAESSLPAEILNFQDIEFLNSYFQTSPVYRQHFCLSDKNGNLKWYRLTANKLNSNDMVLSLEDKTQKISENIVLSTISGNLVGGFIANLQRDVISVVKMTPFFNYLDDIHDKLTIKLGMETLCPHMDEEFREGWRHFSSLENLRSVLGSHRRADYSFMTRYAGEHTWFRASLYAIDSSVSKEPSVALSFKKFSTEELEKANRNEALLHEKEKLERDFRLIKGIATQYISLKIVEIGGRFSVVYKDMDPSYGWDSSPFSNFWDAAKALITGRCHPDDFERMKEFYNRSYIVDLMKGRRRHQERFRFHLENGKYIWLEMVLVRFDKSLDTALTEFAFALANVDVEVQRESEYTRALEQARISKEESRLKTQFVNNISHDIRTPLNAVIGYSQLLSLASDNLDEEEKSEYIRYIESSGELLTMLIDDILSVSDIEHDILRINPALSSCNQICQKATSCCMMRVPNGVNLYFTTEFKDAFRIMTDPRRVQQILINMISNSCKATTEGEIRVHCGKSAEEGYIDFSVTDTGCGVAPDKADQIFKRYVSVDSIGTGGGHGLGLDICFKLSEKMGGRIWLDQSYTSGARFVLTLPA